MLTNDDGDASFTFNTTGVSAGKSITATATSSDNSTSEFSQAVVAQPNPPPVVANDSYSVNEDATLTVSASDGVPKNDTDEDNDSFTAVLETGPSHGTLTLNDDGSFTYTPTANYYGSDSFTYKANDGESSSRAATVSITVTPVNDAPSFTKGADQTVDEDAGATTVNDWATGISAGPSNESSQTLTFDVTNDNTALFSVQPAVSSDGTLTYTPADDANGTANVTVVLDDSEGASSGEQTFTITVNAVNDEPTANDDAKTTPENTDLVFPASDLLDNDSEGPDDESGQTLTVTEVSNPAHGTVELENDQITFKPETDYNGPASFEYTVCDDGSPQECSTQTATVEVTVSPVNSKPVAQDGTSTMDEDGAPIEIDFGALVSDTETADQNLTYTIVSGPTAEQGELSGTGSTRTFDPAAEFNGAVEISYTVTDRGDPDNCGTPGSSCDASETSDQKTVTITVDPVNDAPTDIALSNTSVEENQPSGATVGSFSSTDVDSGDTHTYSLVPGTGDTDNASFDVEGSTLKTKASFDYEAKNSYSIRAQTSDGNGGAFTKAFTISVTDVTEIPDTIIDSGPSGYTTSTSATFAFHSDPSGATFECSLDNAAYQSCSSPKSYTRLAQGLHTFEVRAKNAAGTAMRARPPEPSP